MCEAKEAWQRSSAESENDKGWFIIPIWLPHCEVGRDGVPSAQKLDHEVMADY